MCENKISVGIYGYGPLLSKEVVEAFGVKALDDLNVKMDCVIVAVAHNVFRKMTLEDTERFMSDKSVLVDVRGMFSEEEAKKKGFYYSRL